MTSPVYVIDIQLICSGNRDFISIKENDFTGGAKQRNRERVNLSLRIGANRLRRKVVRFSTELVDLLHGSFLLAKLSTYH